MDNITHSLVGLAVAESYLQARPSKIRGPLYAASLLANNLPDLDFLYGKILSGEMGYLLHHRGHTHTFLGAVPQAAFIVFLLWLYSRWKKTPWTANEWKPITLLSFLGICLHISMDSLNSYGVHPFWPFDSHWYYLDSVFIVEPAVWLALAPPLAMAAVRRWSRILYWGIFLAALGIIIGLPSLPLALKAAYILAADLSLSSTFHFGAKKRIYAGLAYCAAIALILVGISQAVRASVHSESINKFPGDSVYDIVRTPSPANPLCWFFETVGTNPGENPPSTTKYFVRFGKMQVLGVGSFCPPVFRGQPNAPLIPITNNRQEPEARAGITWLYSFEENLTRLQSLASTNCQFSAFLQFARVPFWIEKSEPFYFGDLRFDRDHSRGFAEFSPPENAPCPRFLPGWKAPTEGLLHKVD